VISLLNLKYKDKACDRDSYDINKAAKDIADKTKKEQKISPTKA